MLVGRLLQNSFTSGRHESPTSVCGEKETFIAFYSNGTSEGSDPCNLVDYVSCSLSRMNVRFFFTHAFPYLRRFALFNFWSFSISGAYLVP